MNVMPMYVFYVLLLWWILLRCKHKLLSFVGGNLSQNSCRQYSCLYLRIRCLVRLQKWFQEFNESTILLCEILDFFVKLIIKSLNWLFKWFFLLILLVVIQSWIKLEIFVRFLDPKGLISKNLCRVHAIFFIPDI